MSTQLLAERYELRDTLGTGGMARVLEGYDRVLDRRVAVKLLREDAGGPQSQERFLREARAAASFHHPNAVAVFDTGRDDGTPFIVMELVEGPTLADVIDEQGALDPDRALTIADQVLAALGEAHRRGLVHRDVKPANIMLPRHGEAKLTDFGIAKSVRETGAGLTLAGQVFGTPKYLSPEQVNGQQATPRSDVYSLGITLYEMLAGEPPFTGENAIAVALAHTEDEPAPLDRIRQDLDPAIVAFVHRALEKDALTRFSDAREMRDALRQARAGVAPAYAPTQHVGERTDRADRTQRASPGAGTTRVLEREPATPSPDEPRRGGRLWLWVTVAALVLLAVVLAGAWFADLLDGEIDPTDEPVDEEPADPEDPDAPEEAPDDPADDPVEEAPPGDPPADDPEPPADDPAEEAPPADPPADDPDPPADPEPPAGEGEAPEQSRPAPGQPSETPPGESDAPPADPVERGDDGPEPPPAEPAASEQDPEAEPAL